MFVTSEIATVVGNLVDGCLYGYYENIGKVKILTKVNVICQDGPLTEDNTLHIQRDGVTVLSVVIPADSQPDREEQVVTIDTSIILTVGQSLRVLVVAPELGAPAANVKVFGVLDIIS